MRYEDPSLEELVELRRFLQEFCRGHFRSVTRFLVPTEDIGDRDPIEVLAQADPAEPEALKGWGFEEYLGERDQEGSLIYQQIHGGVGDGSDRSPLPKHLTTTATCIESLHDCPDEFWPSEHQDLYARWEALARGFYAQLRDENTLVSLKKTRDHLFCATRVLSVMMRSAPGLGESDFNVLQHHVDHVLEWSAEPRTDPEQRIDKGAPPLESAFQAFWTLRMLAVYRRATEKRRENQSEEVREPLPHEDRWQALLLGCRQHLSIQITLHKSESESCDTDELGWALAAFIRFDPKSAQRAPGRELFEQGLECLFSKQMPSGAWRSTRPVFNRIDRWPAYSYPYELMTCLLKAGLTPGAVSVREGFQRYVPQLRRFAHHAREIRIPLGEDSDPMFSGWHSGYLQENAAEAWATACVFQFAQTLRKVCAIWTSEEATRLLQLTRRPTPPARDLGQVYEEFWRRGQTWRFPGKNYEAHEKLRPRLNVHEQLMTLFVNPIRYQGYLDRKKQPRRLDPYDRCIAPHQARSAILFGPPGSSKSSLVQQVATLVGWHFVELHSSDFVRDGLQSVHRTADAIFERLLELDHAVVLFDEIDELVRVRQEDTGMEGRFLTTSMLPKLAELWKHRRVVFFVATNHLRFFDAAIRRTGRFDAVLYAPTSAFEVKARRLLELLEGDPGRHRVFPSSATEALEPLRREIEDALSIVRRTLDLFHDEAFLEQAGRSRLGKQVDKERLDLRFEEASRAAASYWVEAGGPSVDVINGAFELSRFALLRYDQLPELALELLMEFADEQVPLSRGEIHVTEKQIRRALRRVRDFDLDRLRPYMEFFEGQRLEAFDYGMRRLWHVSAGGQKLLDDLLKPEHGHSRLREAFVSGPPGLERAGGLRSPDDSRRKADWYFCSPKQLTREYIEFCDAEVTLRIARSDAESGEVDVALRDF